MHCIPTGARPVTTHSYGAAKVYDFLIAFAQIHGILYFTAPKSVQQPNWCGMQR